MILALIIPRAGCAHKLLADNKNRLWIIGGRNVGTRNLTMISMKIPDADCTGGRDDRQGLLQIKFSI